MNDIKTKIAFYTLGCKLNYSETATISGDFIDNGYQKVPFNEKADVYVINTCCVTQSAEKKCRQAINKAIRQSPNAKIIVTGCYAQVKSGELAKIQGVDSIIGSEDKFALRSVLDQISQKNGLSLLNTPYNQINTFFPASSSGDRTRSFLKIQDGCDYWCSYCIIPQARGKSRNAPVSKIVEQAQKLGQTGIKEIVITGVNIGDFGKSTGESFFDLIQQLDKVCEIERYRISSIEPDLLHPEVIDFVAESKKFAPHFHIPLQSGCDKILQHMNRRYKRQVFHDKTTYIKSKLPDAGIGVDVIVGFPGETDEDFNDTCSFLKSIPFSYLHVFSFSAREKTKAYNMPGQVDPKIKSKRSKMLQALSNQKKHNFLKNHIGKQAHVLFESTKKNNTLFGFTGNYIKVEAPYDQKLINTIRKVELTGINPSGNMRVRIN
jgi:threonylcarbamoyladenosine tRNA methylthiotransferase MtaB